MAYTAMAEWTSDMPATVTKLEEFRENDVYLKASARLERAGADELDGDHLDIDMTPTAYVPDTTPAEAANVDDLAAHLYGIDVALGKYKTLNVWIGGGIMYPSDTSGCDQAAIGEYTTNHISAYLLGFANDSTEYGEFRLATPDDWDGGTITAKFYWITTSRSSGTKVRWELQFISSGDNDAIDTAWGTEQGVSDTFLANDDLHVSAATAAITPAGTPAAGEILRGRVYRDHDHADDDINAKCYLEGIMLTLTRSLS